MPADTKPGPTALIHPQMAAALKRNAEIVAQVGGAGEAIGEVRSQAEAARAIWNEGGPQLAVNMAHTIPGPFRDIPVQLYKPSDKDGLPVFVYLHGGGFRIGGPLSNDRQMREIAQTWGGAIVSADYVHAPEHTFPDPVTEAVAVLEWIADNGADWASMPDASRWVARRRGRASRWVRRWNYATRGAATFLARRSRSTVCSTTTWKPTPWPNSAAAISC